MISVIIPTHNRSLMLEQAIQSVLTQKNVDVEIIVVDDNSTDETAQTVSKYPELIYHKNSVNLGPGISRRYGYNISHGEYVVFMDDDDYYTDDFFYSKAVSIMSQNDSLALVCANSSIRDFDTERLYETYLNYEGKVNGVEFLSKFPFEYKKPNSTFPTLFRRFFLERASFSTMKMMNDNAIYMRALMYGDVYAISDNVGVYRVHGGNISNTVSFDFILSNLEEKEYVLNSIKTRIEDPAHWWYRQFKITFVYWCQTKHQLREELKFLRWGITHIHGSMELLIWLEYRFLILARKILQ